MGLTYCYIDTPTNRTTEASRKSQVLGAHGNLVHDFCSITNEGSALEGLGHFAILNQVGFFYSKVELSCSSNATTAHLFAVNPFVDGGEQIFVGVFSRCDIGIAHP